MNKNLFTTKTQAAKADTKNQAGGLAYSLQNEEALAQIACTGCFNNTYYATGEQQLNEIISLANKVKPEFLAKVAVYARQNGNMKDTPAILLAILVKKNPALARTIAPKILTNFKMVMNFVQAVRSGKFGGKSMGSAPTKMVQQFFDKVNDERLFNDSIGANPSVVDIIRLCHIKPKTVERANLMRYMMGLPYQSERLPKCVVEYEAFKRDQTQPLPSVDWRLLVSFPLTDSHWNQIGERMNWHALRMNLNKLHKHNTFNDKTRLNKLAAKLADPEQVKKVKVFPYQLYNTFLNTTDLPSKIRNATQEALDHSVSNLKTLDNIDKLYICLDVSGSMISPVTGHRAGATTSVSCVQAGALFAATFAKVNSDIDTKIVLFENSAKEAKLNLKDSLATIATSISTPGGGTNCTAAMELIKKDGITKNDRIAIIFFSDNMSWLEYQGGRNWAGSTGMASTWLDIKRRTKEAKLVLVDVQPYTTTQAQTDKDVLNVGGFSDSVFDVVYNFLNNGNANWVDVINSVQLDSTPVQVVIEEINEAE